MELTMKILLISLFMFIGIEAQAISREEIKQSQIEIEYSLKQEKSSDWVFKDSANTRMDAYNQQRNRERRGTNGGLQPVNFMIPLLWYTY